MGSELIEPDDKALIAAERQIIERTKTRAIIPLTSALADEFEARAKSGKLKKELKTMKASALIGNLTRLLTAIKDNAPKILINNAPHESKDATWLRANSATNLSEEDRAKRRKQVEKENG